MVTGGTHSGRNLDSTELLKPGASEWEVISGGELISPRRGLRAATLNNKIFVTGKTENMNKEVCFKYIISNFRRIRI